ncbi:acyltransferase [Bradyrhizobium sp. B124]|uniref:acyltransferase family protein n=1 Tax=Bradyrhizobium sp. B124 TaxID=3140245 RepID=UPI003183B9EE
MRPGPVLVEGELALERDRIGELDGLRAIALLIVVIWHYFGAPDGPQGWPWKLLHVGRFGVDLFFILSGYLITDILLRHRAAERYYSAFYGRRAFRIWPLYYLMCGCAAVGWYFSLSPDLFDTRGVPGWLYLFGLQNFGMAKAQTDGAFWLAVTWSLAIEEQFYLLFPLLVRNIPTERLFAILLVPILICPIGRLIDSALPDAYGWYVLPQFRIDSLAIGALIAWWRLYRKPDAEVSRRVAAILKWSSMSLPLLWLFGWKRWSVAFSHTQVEIFFGSLLFVVLENRGSPKLALLRSSVANFFAKTSYAAYLTHHVIVYLLFAVLHQPRTVESLAGLSLTFSALALTFALCALSYRYFERPLLDFAHRRFSFG